MLPTKSKLSKREVIMVYLLLVIIIIVSMITFLLKPIMEKNSLLDEALFELKSKEITMSRSISSLTKQQENLARQEQEVDLLLDGVFPLMTNNQIDNFVTELVLKCNLQPSSLSITEAQPKELMFYLAKDPSKVNMYVTTINVRLEGLKDDLVLLIDLLASNNSIKIGSCALSAKDDGIIGNDSIINITLGFEIYMHEEGHYSVSDVINKIGETP